MVWSCFKWHLITGILYERQFQQFKVLPTFFFNGVNKIRESLHMRALRGDEHLTFEKGKCQCWNQMLLQRVSRKKIFGKIGAERKTKVANKNSFSFLTRNPIGVFIQRDIALSRVRDKHTKNKCRILLTAFGGKGNW